jgi:hypothetical protein
MYKSFVQSGKQIEKQFAQVAANRGWLCEFASHQADCNEHWDVKITREPLSFLVDVKGRKKITRSGQLQDQWIWLELHGVRAKDQGWLYSGRADLIAFETLDSFLLVDRDRLIDLVEELVPPTKERVDWADEAKYKIYQRQGRSDLLTMIESAKIQPIAFQVWEK